MGLCLPVPRAAGDVLDPHGFISISLSVPLRPGLPDRPVRLRLALEYDAVHPQGFRGRHIFFPIVNIDAFLCPQAPQVGWGLEG